ncbi:MAG: hypothetical protein ABL958_01625 [Bdellovibrionia bacterium]
MGFLLLFGPFQNCTLYESADRKELNEKGFSSSSGCAPYIDAQKAKDIFGSDMKVSFASAGAGPLTCLISVDGAPQTGHRKYTCSISTANVDRAKAPSGETLIGANSSTAPYYYYTYARQDTESALKTYIITLGVYEGRREGINCGAVFDGSPTAEDQQLAVELGQALTDAMATNAPLL